MVNKTPEISVIVPALNEEKYIMSVFEGLKRQKFRNFEVIVVDGNSIDRTREIARKYGKVVIKKGRNIGAARNAGVKLARGRILFFTDADTRASPDLLESYHRAFKDKNLVAATGPILPLEQTINFLKFCFIFDTVMLTKLRFKVGDCAIIGSNFAVRKEAFESSGGFSESLVTCEDLDLSYRLRRCGAIRYVDEAVISTSVRRVLKWGLIRYALFHVETTLMFFFFKRTKINYELVR